MKHNVSSADAPQRGFVVWFDATRGFGFVRDERGQDWFVHYRAIESPGFRTLAEGQEIYFTLKDTLRGPQVARAWISD